MSKTLKDSLMIKGPKEKTRGLSVSLGQKLSYLMPDIAFNSGVPQFPQLENKGTIMTYLYT